MIENKIKEEFIKKFGYKYSGGSVEWDKIDDDIIEFIESKLSQALETRNKELVEELQQMMNNKCPVGEPTGYCCNYHYYLDDIITLLQSK